MASYEKMEDFSISKIEQTSKKRVDHHYKNLDLISRLENIYALKNEKIGKKTNEELEAKKLLQIFRANIPRNFEEEEVALSEKASKIADELNAKYNIKFDLSDKTTLHMQVDAEIENKNLVIRKLFSEITANLNESNSMTLLGRVALQISDQEKQAYVRNQKREN